MAVRQTNERSIRESHDGLIGRQDLLERLVDLVANAGPGTRGPGGGGRGRPVTLVGLPGVGKSRLLEAWAMTVGADPITLEGRATVGEVTAAILERLPLDGSPPEGRPPQRGAAARAEALLDELRRGPRALALDSIDDLDAAALRLLDKIAATGSPVVATSRVVPISDAFGVLTVPPLDVPRGPGAQAARQSSAVRLLIESAQRAGALESVDDEAWIHAGTIASRLEGLPLALGVAAAQVRALGLARLAEVLTRDDHAAEARLKLSETVGRSLDRLSPEVLEVLELGATFGDGFSIAELEGLLGRELTEALATLVSHSLVSVRPLVGSASHLRYSIHAVVRLTVLSRCPPERRASIDRQQASYRGRLAEALVEAGPTAVLEIARTERSLREAFAWATTNGPKDPDARRAGSAIAAALGMLVEAHGASSALVEVLEAAVVWATDPTLPPARRAALAFYAGYARVEHIDLTPARERLELARELAGGGVNQRIEASAYAQLAWLAARYGDTEEATRLREKIEMPPGREDPWILLLTSALDTLMHANFGRHEAARAAAEQWRTQAVGLGEGTHESYVWGVVGCIALDRGEVGEALRHLEHAIELAERFDARISGAIFRGYRAIALHVGGQPSAEAYDEAIEQCDRTGALLYSGLFRAWAAVLQIQRGEIIEGARMLDLLIAANSWEMPRAVLTAMRAHVEVAEARQAASVGDVVRQHRSLAEVAQRIQRTTDDERHRMIQLRIVGQVLSPSFDSAVPKAPAARGISIAVGGAAVARDGIVERLDRYPTQARLAWALALTRLTEPGASIDSATLFARGWPGEKHDARGRQHRLRVALSSLRTAGLAGVLEHHGDGYRLDPTLPLTLFAATNEATTTDRN